MDIDAPSETMIVLTAGEPVQIQRPIKDIMGIIRGAPKEDVPISVELQRSPVDVTIRR